MKLTKITLSALAVLALSTTINAKDKCQEAVGMAFGEVDTYGWTYKVFIREKKAEKEGLEFLIKHCDANKYGVDKKTIEASMKYLNKATKASEAEWEKEYKLKY